MAEKKLEKIFKQVTSIKIKAFEFLTNFTWYSWYLRYLLQNTSTQKKDQGFRFKYPVIKEITMPLESTYFQGFKKLLIIK